MALSLVNARARTRGKSPVEFEFKAVGRLSPRFVTDKDGNPILMSTGEKPEQVKYALVGEKNEKGEATNRKDSKGELIKVLPFELDSQKNPVAPEGTRFVMVDDVETSGLTDDFQEVLNLFGSLSDDERGYVTVAGVDAEGKPTSTKTAKTPLQMVIESALDGYNYNSRKNASPVSEQVSEDELTPITAALVEHKILSEQDATTWRRSMTSTSKLMEIDRLVFAKSSPQYKKLVAAGWKPVEVAA